MIAGAGVAFRSMPTLGTGVSRGGELGQAGGSFQDVVRRRQQAGFVARADELARFRENLVLPAADPDRRFIFCVHGDGGVGKTFLLRRLRSIADGQGAATAWVDEPIFGVPDGMKVIASELARQGEVLGGFTEVLDNYLRRRFEVEADPDAAAGVPAFMTRTAVRIGLHAAHAAPGAGDLADSVGAAEQADRLRIFFGTKFRRDEDVPLWVSPLDALTRVFVRDLASVGRQRPLVLFFDSYEQTGPWLDGWLRSVLDGLYGDLPQDLVVTVAGRHPLDPGGWAPYAAVLADVPLTPFSEAEARQLLAGKRVTDERVVEVILMVSGRLPLLVATLAENQPTGPGAVGDPSGAAVERFLKWEPDPARRALAIAAALPRAVNEDVLGVLVGGPDQPDGDQGRLFTWLRSLPFVTHEAGRIQYHEVVRTAMIRLERRQSPTRWRKRHRDLAATYRRWRLDLSGEDAWDNPSWRAHKVEETYHLLCADLGKALPSALSEVAYACAKQLTTAARWAQMIAQAGDDAGSDAIRAWGRRLAESLRGSQNEATVTCLGILLREGNLEEAAVPVALRSRGRALYFLDHDFAALADLDRAISLTPDDHRTLAYRADTHRWLGRPEEALADYDRAIELDPADAPAIAGRGQTYRLMGRQEEALADYDRAIELDPATAWPIAMRADAYQLMGRHEEALADYDRAIELDQAYAWAIASRGETYRLMGRHKEALADYDRAIELDQAYAPAIAGRGETYRLMGRPEEALADYGRAIELDPADSSAIAGRGQSYHAMGRYEEALADYGRAIELDPADDWAVASRGETYHAMGRYEEALADYDRAIELDPADDWYRYACSLAHTCRGELDEAARNLATSVDLVVTAIQTAKRPGKDLYNLIIYRAALGNYEQACRDVMNAIEQAPNIYWVREATDDLRALSGVPNIITLEVARLIDMLSDENLTNLTQREAMRVIHERVINSIT